MGLCIWARRALGPGVIKLGFGYWQAAHRGRTPEGSACELCETVVG